MDSTINRSEVNKMPSTENVMKLFKKLRKGSLLSTEIINSGDQISDLKDCNSSEVVGNGKVEPEQNIHLLMQLQFVNSLNMIEEIKTTISEFEQNCLKISKLTPEIDYASLMKNFNIHKSEEHGLQNKCIEESNSDKPLRSEIISYLFLRKHSEKIELKRFENPAEVPTLLKNMKSAISYLERTWCGKTQKNYPSESPTESEEEQSSDSAYDPRNSTFAGDSSRKRRRSSRVTKVGRKSRGRPRKLFVDDRSSESAPEIREKKFPGRPRKTVIDDEKSSLSNGEPQPKKSRGRPRKYTLQENMNSPSSVKESNDNVKQESDSLDSKDKDSSNDKNTGDSTETSEKHDSEIVVTKHKGRPSKNEIEVKDKRPRGRPKSILVSGIHKDASEATNNYDSVVAKSRGRPKKSKIPENEPLNSTPN